MLASTAWCQSARCAPVRSASATGSGKECSGVWGLGLPLSFVVGYSIPDNQNIKIMDMNTNQDNPLSSCLLTWPQHVHSPSGGRMHAWPADGTTSVMFPFMGMDKQGQLGQIPNPQMVSPPISPRMPYVGVQHSEPLRGPPSPLTRRAASTYQLHGFKGALPILSHLKC